MRAEYILETNAARIRAMEDVRVYTKIGGIRALVVFFTNPTTTLPCVVAYQERTGEMYTLESMQMRDWVTGASVFDGTITKTDRDEWAFYAFNALMYSDMHIQNKIHRIRLACLLHFVTKCRPRGNMVMVMQPQYSLVRAALALEANCHVEGLVFVTDDALYKWNFKEKVRGVLRTSEKGLLAADGYVMQTGEVEEDGLVECRYLEERHCWSVVRVCLDRKKAQTRDELERVVVVNNTHIPIDELLGLVQ